MLKEDIEEATGESRDKLRLITIRVTPQMYEHLNKLEGFVSVSEAARFVIRDHMERERLEGAEGTIEP